MNPLPKSIAELTEPSEYLEEILATPPQWIIRWAPIGVLLLIILLLALGWLIRYPDRLSGEIVITTPMPPVAVVARVDGYLADILVTDHDTVAGGEVLGILQNPARYEDVSQLRQTLHTLKAGNAMILLKDSLLFPYYQLGRLQEYYVDLQEAWRVYKLYQQLIPHTKEQQALNRQLAQYQHLLTQKQAQQLLLSRKAALAEKDYRRNEQLHATHTVADKALEASEREWLEARQVVEVLESEIAQIQVDVSQLVREGQQLTNQQMQTEGQLQNRLLSAMDHLQAAIAAWEEQYLLKAPQAGRVSLFERWSPKQYVQAGQAILRVIPLDDQPIVGQVRLPVRNSGKVAVGQRVRVYLDNYPPEEYGFLIGSVESLSELPEQGYYQLIIRFPKGLITHFGQALPFRQQLTGKAEIITEKRRLLERLFSQFKTRIQH